MEYMDPPKVDSGRQRRAPTAWTTAPQHHSNLSLDAFVVMPNHRHIIDNPVRWHECQVRAAVGPVFRMANFGKACELAVPFDPIAWDL